MRKGFLKISLFFVIALGSITIFPEQTGALLKKICFSFEKILTFISKFIDCFIPGFKVTNTMVFSFLILLALSPFFYRFILFLVKKIQRYIRKKKNEVGGELFFEDDYEEEYEEEEEKEEKDSKEEKEAKEEKEEPDFSRSLDYNREVVVKFFLKIFKLQIGELQTAPGQYKFIDSINIWPNRVYELAVIHNDEWVKRRLTIGPLGDEGVSKSVCYYVIYDDHMVVKVPPEPIDDFDEYLSYIEADMKIAKRLAPKECIIPKVSVILGRLLSKSNVPDVYSEKNERDYIERLQKNSQLQEYLKIGDTFVFFMDLSKFYFLSNIVKEMHNMDNLLPLEILNHPDIIWDEYAFEGRYGKEHSHVGYEMRNIYDEYEREISRLLIQYGVASSLPTYNMKSWFLIHLSGKGRIETNDNFSEVFIEDLNSLSRESMIDNRSSIQSYRLVIREYIARNTIAKHRIEMSSIITNLIGLLTWLGKKQVALRDLKPDNLLIAGDPECYPQFLRKVDQYSIGFIDLETAVDYSGEIDDIIQPQLGGTPKYATPSHLFTNELLTALYGDLRRILHLQDWYAAVAMIFRIVTGSTMFEKTATLLPEIKRIIESTVNENDQLISITEYVSRMFWKSAFDEFGEKITRNRKILNYVKVIILERDKAVLMQEIVKERKIINNVILKKINKQQFFKSKDNREKIYHASIDTLAAMRVKCETGISNSIDKAAIIQFFVEIDLLKKQLAQRQTVAQFLKSTKSEIPVVTIMELMFNIVFTAMYTEVWGVLTTEFRIDTVEKNSGTSYDTTI